MNNYENLKDELGTISKILNDYPEVLQPKVFDILVNAYFSEVGIETQKSVLSVNEQIESNDDKAQEEEPKVKKTVKGSTKKSPSKGESYTLVKTLDLSGKENGISFKDYVDKHPANSAIKFNVLVVGYLQHVMGLEEITFDHVYTCYKSYGKRIPEKLKQSIYDASSKKGYLNCNEGNISLTTIGENLLDELAKGVDK